MSSGETVATPRVLVADDDRGVREALRLLLKQHGLPVATATSPPTVLAALQENDFDLLVMDLNYARDTTSGAEGIQLLQRIVGLDSTLPVVIMTAWGTVELAVEAMRLGARDFVEKPWDNERLLTVVRTQLELRRALRREQRLEAENRVLRTEGLPDMVAHSRPMRAVLQLIAQVAPSDASLLITGEHGTGKELAAKTIHALSRRAARSMVTVNAGGLPEGVFESELFGHVRGAFTDARTDRVGRFDLADGGTLFLDEIGNLSLGQQAKLLRTVQSGELERVGSSRTRRVDVRLLCATNSDLRAEVAAGRFREDLLFRLNTIEIHLPPLRQRREDIAPLAMQFLAQHAARYGKTMQGFEPAALQLMLEHAWPGNVRELEHAVERAVLLAPSSTIAADVLALRSESEATPQLDRVPLEVAEKILVERALQRHGGNVQQAARALGLSRAAVYRRLQRFGL